MKCVDLKWIIPGFSKRGDFFDFGKEEAK